MSMCVYVCMGDGVGVGGRQMGLEGNMEQGWWWEWKWIGVNCWGGLEIGGLG